MTHEDRVPARLLGRAAKVSASEGKAGRWLTRTHHPLDGRNPAEAAQTEDGLGEVTDLLGRIEHDIFAWFPWPRVSIRTRTLLR